MNRQFHLRKSLADSLLVIRVGMKSALISPILSRTFLLKSDVLESGPLKVMALSSLQRGPCFIR
jgi:hypothetical protein